MRDDAARRDAARAGCAALLRTTRVRSRAAHDAGGPADGGIFPVIADDLAADHTVVTYDPRGLSHSTLEGHVDDERLVGIMADDVHRLIEATGEDKAFEFASSGGAVISLD